MIYPSPVSAPAREKRISWDSSLHPRTGTPRSGRLPRVRRSGTLHPRSVGTHEAPFQVFANLEYANKSFKDMRLDDYEGSQVTASQAVAGRRETPAKGSPARSLFGGPFASPSTSRIGERHATPFPTVESHSHFTFGACNGEFGGQRAMQVPAPPSLNRSSALFLGAPTSSYGPHAFPSAPFGVTFRPSTYDASNGLSGGQRTMQAPAPLTSEVCLNCSSSALFQSAPASTYDASASCFAFRPSNGEYGRQPPLTFSDLASARFHAAPTFEPHPPTFTFGASNGLVEGKRAQQDLSNFLGGIESPVPSHTSFLEDSPALTPAIFDSPFAVRTIDAPVSRTRFRPPTQSPPLVTHTPTSDSGGLGTFGASGLDVLASITRSAHSSGSFGPDAKPRTPSSSLFEQGGLLCAQARLSAGLFDPAANGGLFSQPAPTASTSLSQQQPPARVARRSHDRSVRAARRGLPGAENVYAAEFERLISMGNVVEAAKLVAVNGTALRTPATIARFQQVPAHPGSPQPLFQYFAALLETGRLNEQESIELAKAVMQQGRPQLMEKWLKEDKLQCSEALGDLIMPHDVGMALSVYLHAECHAKAIQCFVQTGEYVKIVPYSSSVGFKMDYSALLAQLVNSNPQGALDLAKCLVNAEGGRLIDIQATAEQFLSQNRVQETTAFLLEALKDNKPEHAYLQTRLREINLIGGAPQVADVPSQQKYPAARAELESDDRSVRTDQAVASPPHSPSSHSKKTQSNTSGRVVRKAAKARGLFVDASLEEVRRIVGFETPDHIESAINKAQLEGALRALKDGLFHCNLRHFNPEPNHSGRDPIRVSGKKSVLQYRLMWFLFHVEVDFSED